MKTANISVVIPTHNRPGGLAAAVKSIFRQTLLPKELIVVDDGSSPPISEEVFAGCPAGLSTKLLRNESPKGANNARNRGIKEATGEWIAFLDDDDEFFAQKIDVINEYILNNPSADLLYHPAKIIMVNEGISYTTKPKELLPNDNVFRKLLIKNHIGGTPMVVAKKQSLLLAGGFDENLPALQDYELWLRMAGSKHKFFFIPLQLTLCNYTTKTKGITANQEAGLQALSIIEQKYADAFSSLSKKEKRIFNMRKQNRLIRIALLNKNNMLASRLFWQGFLKFKKLKYLAGAIVSLFGSGFVFWLRSKKDVL